jgi:hypothetical protein
MAKAIRATPKLTKIETNDFISSMLSIERNKVSKSDKILAKEIIDNFSC